MSAAAPDPGLEPGRIDPRLAEELPGMRLIATTVEGGARRTPGTVRARLDRIADRISGAQAVNLRHRPIPWAYRVFFRHIGLDPDEQRTPVEQLSFERIAHGGLRARGLPADAITVATLESHVALGALDADALDPPIEIRPSRGGEALEGRAGALPEGTIVLADGRRVLSLLFGAPVASAEVTRRSRRTLIWALGVEGVPSIALEEAVWLAAELLAERPAGG